ncbi:tail fiber assembly protein [Xenorhabdus sp. SGI240]|uniref:tail fiber assembly protein n=1 Tax=Xenorhabdus sp. SGI240 TaxID=3158262 RepID=UPI0032B75DBA
MKFFNAPTYAFYDSEINTAIPDTAIEITDELCNQLFQDQATGKTIVADTNGYPITVAQPPTPAHTWNGSEWVADMEEATRWYVKRAGEQKQNLMTQAANAIAPLQDAIDLDMATDAEKSALTTWRKYRVLLNRVDCATAPDIQWPEQPE